MRTAKEKSSEIKLTWGVNRNIKGPNWCQSHNEKDDPFSNEDKEVDGDSKLQRLQTLYLKDVFNKKKRVGMIEKMER